MTRIKKDTSSTHTLTPGWSPRRRDLGTAPLIGIDPGTERAGLAVIVPSARGTRAWDVHTYAIRVHGDRPRLERVALIAHEMARCVEWLDCPGVRVAIEDGFAKYATAAQALGEARGAIAAILHPWRITAIPVARVRALALGRASSKRDAASSLIGLGLGAGSRTPDEYDAIVVALACAYK